MRCPNCSTSLSKSGAFCPACGSGLRIIPPIPPMDPHAKAPIPLAGWLWTASITLGTVLSAAGLFYSLPPLLFLGLALLAITGLFTLIGSFF